MDHIFVLEAEADELTDLVKGVKSTIIHGSDSGSEPYGMVEEGDSLYLSEDTNPSKVKAVATVSKVFNSGRLSEAESFQLVIQNQERLMLPDSIFYKWAGKHYLVLITLEDVRTVEPFNFEPEDESVENICIWPGGAGKSIFRNRLSA